eukprot:CAMPEP_0113936786 /NCGR_PEP_ID=MMETSP1339-20121228/3584_1 /TAXON_ID=94617 /ORGANISM="Fibrocapsa japonica" /LENGTH=241 /DNA_ID=CAMNT_0000939337 /DNA_START=54 /DNA_END=779 /DNA_ORIENTATION=+ /assembly_acc=CAM_ASM_000762
MVKVMKATTIWILSTFPFLFIKNATTFCNAASIPTTTPKVFCYGDSLTAGTSPPLNQDFPYGKHLQDGLRTIPGLESSLVRWRGHPGWTSSALLNQGHFSSMVDDIHAKVGTTLDLIVILAGTNDLAYETDGQAILDSITGMHCIAHSKGCKTMALGIPSSAWQMQSNSARSVAKQVNSNLESWAEENKSMTTFVPFPIEGFNTESGFWAPDGLHFSPDGYKEMGESLVPYVADVLNGREP